MPTLKYDLTDQVFGLLTALHHVGSGNWLVRCECGTEKRVMGQNLREGRLKSCGCRNPRPRMKGGADHPRWKADGDVTYATAHKRVASHRGAACLHACIGCDEPASSWAYRGDSPRERTEAARPGHKWKAPDGVLRYSPDPADYDPMCWRCHARKDIAAARARL